MITIEKCACGRCSDYWLVGIGKFCQGSGFTQAEAQRIADALNERNRREPTAHEIDVAFHKEMEGKIYGETRQAYQWFEAGYKAGVNYADPV